MISTSSKKFREIIAKSCGEITAFARENEQIISKAVWNEFERRCSKTKNQILGETTVNCPEISGILDGATYLLAAGKTFDTKDVLKNAGGKWVPDLGGWVYPVESCRELQSKLDIKDVKIAPRAAVAFVRDEEVKKSIRSSFNPAFHEAMNRFMHSMIADPGKIATANRKKLVRIAGTDMPDDQLADEIAGDPAKRSAFWKDVDELTVPSVFPADPGKALNMLSDKTAVMTDCSLFPSREDPRNSKCTVIKAVIEAKTK